MCVRLGSVVPLLFGLAIGFSMSQLSTLLYLDTSPERGVHGWEYEAQSLALPRIHQFEHADHWSQTKRVEKAEALRSVYESSLSELQQKRLISLEEYETREQRLAQLWPQYRKPRRKVAVVTSITEGKTPYTVTPELLNSMEGYVDSCAALAASVRKHMMTSEKFEIEMVAMVAAREWIRPFHRKLEAFGFKVIEAESPVMFDEIAEGYYKDTLNQSGCCGMSELMKLHAFTLTKYYRVVLLDTDAFVVQNFDELLDMDPNVGLIYTNGTMQGEIFQGGMWIVRPNMTVFDGMCDCIRRGAFYSGSAWEKSGVGWLYGGATIQGLVPFWFMKKEAPERSVRVDRCMYNYQGAPDCGFTDETAAVKFENIKIYHSTLCQKAFKCLKVTVKPYCVRFFEMWWQYTREMENYLGLEPRPGCDFTGRSPHGREYQFIDLDRRAGDRVAGD